MRAFFRAVSQDLASGRLARGESPHARGFRRGNCHARPRMAHPLRNPASPFLVDIPRRPLMMEPATAPASPPLTIRATTSLGPIGRSSRPTFPCSEGRILHQFPGKRGARFRRGHKDEKLISKAGDPGFIKAYSQEAVKNPELALAAYPPWDDMWKRETMLRVQNWTTFLRRIKQTVRVSFAPGSDLEPAFEEAIEKITDPND